MKRFFLQLFLLVMAFGMFGPLLASPAQAAPSRAKQAETYCKSFPNTATSTRISKAKCERTFIAGYTEGGASKRSVCPTSLRGQLRSCERTFVKGEERGEADRAAAQDASNNNTSNNCSGKGVKVSKALGVGGCIGGGNQNPIFALVAYGVQFLTGIFGVILILVLVIAGLQYVVSGDDPEIAKEAKERIKGAFTGLVLFIIMFALVQMILPPDVKIFTSS